METVLKRYISFYESLSKDTLVELKQLVTEDVFFSDPFNEVHGVEGYSRVLEDMFRRCHEPRFFVLHSAVQGSTAYLRWRFEFGKKRRSIEGVSELQFVADGRVARHVDFWDTSSQLYESIPILSFLFKGLRRFLAA